MPGPSHKYWACKRSQYYLLSIIIITMIIMIIVIVIIIICHPNADSYRDMDPNQIYRQHETEKKRQYASRILEVEQATFMPLVFSTTG